MSLTDDFLSDPLKFAETWAICPPNEVTGYRGKEATLLDTAGYKGIGPAPDEPRESVAYSRIMRSKKVAYIELFNDMRPGGKRPEDSNEEGINVVRMNRQFDQFGEARPVYFLPWDKDGAIIKLRIPEKGIHRPDPAIFFTAAINGCSIFVQGTPDSPTVYHAGGDTKRKDHNDAARFWRQALANHLRDSESARARGKIQAEVNKTQYIKTPGTTGNATTPVAEQYERELKKLLDKKGSFQITMVNPWGCVFGVRSGDDWSFYLQENATVVCNYVSKAGNRQVSYARPMQLSKIYPGGSSLIAMMSHTVPVTIS